MGRIPKPSTDSAALVTGASSGIGDAFARELASRGHGVVLVARREERLRALADELSREHGVRAEAIACDLADPSARERLVARIAELGLRIDVLANNAGFGTAGPFVEQDHERELGQIRVMCEAVADLSHRFGAEMAARGSGAILNVASTSSFQPLPRTAGYGAAKAWELSFSVSLAEELRERGVAVTALCPGPVSTEFFEVSGPHPVEGFFPKFVFISPERAAHDGLAALDRGKRVRVPGPLLTRAFLRSNRWIPYAVQLPLMKRLFREPPAG